MGYLSKEYVRITKTLIIPKYVAIVSTEPSGLELPLPSYRCFKLADVVCDVEALNALAQIPTLKLSRWGLFCAWRKARCLVLVPAVLVRRRVGIISTYNELYFHIAVKITALCSPV